jgi:hypothetical protein
MGVIRTRLAGRVKDQGDRPTCVAFAATSLHEYWRDIIAGNEVEVTLNLSEEFLYYGCKQRDGLTAGSGTTLTAANKSLTLEGQCLEALHPYQVSNGPLRKPSAVAFTDAATRILAGLVRRETKWGVMEIDLESELPVIGVIEVFDNARRLDLRGVLNAPSASEKSLGLHAVLLLEVEATAQEQSVVFLNSWGTRWGDGGLGQFGKKYFKNYCKQLWTIPKERA